MSPFLLPGIPLIVLVLLNAGVGGWLYYYLHQRRFNGRWKEVREDGLALGVGFCAFAIFLGLMIAFEAFESNPDLNVLVGLGGALKFGMVGVLAGQVLVAVALLTLRKQLFEKEPQSQPL